VSQGLVSRGYIQTGGVVIATEPVSAPAPLGSPPSLTQPVLGDVTVIIPTAPNICLLATENIFANLRVRQASSFDLPSLYKRAYLVAYETDEIATVKPKT